MAWNLVTSGGLAFGQSAKSPGSSEALSGTLDCIVASVGDEAITESDVLAEVRLERFLNGQAADIPPDHKTYQQARERLIERNLLGEDAAAQPSEAQESTAAAKIQWEETRKRYSTPEAFQAALRSLGMNEQQVIAELVEEQKVLGMVDRRLRPQAAVEPSEIEAYYRDHFTPEFRERGAGTLPPLPEVEGQIREILIQRKIDALLAQWMEELKTTRRVVYHSFCDHEPS